MTPRDGYTCEWVECLHHDGQLYLFGWDAAFIMYENTGWVESRDGPANKEGACALVLLG